ncbi:V-type ATP synthase subunit A [Geoalkalibacter halelectricus]|uniref:V-type ATP synthase alpha chain n=1 Tax=Geoalkalibacter halelectricus TaxID=2847045 RepID=A0ABY5ZRM7_9BACT|nr:V-type ATP synthase subunit A [Geoalkalibacter halelectricus]MDO3379948.1 V-type ATP synthase subunit A [Geoalkalibacter halelectricus]UWZ80525.1 V-type ATP synthase subunit A [Geoalkalibacter halelectricus]
MNPSDSPSEVRVRIRAVSGNVVDIEIGQSEAPVALMKNEVVYLLPQGGERLQAEVLRVRGRVATVQVFEETRGLAVGDQVELTAEMLSVELGPGLLAQVYDGLQNPLSKMAERHGVFLPRGAGIEALDRKQKWSFVSCVKTGDRLRAGDTLGTVQEGRFTHRIMVPFDQRGEVEVTWIQQGNLTVDTPIASIREADKPQVPERTLAMMQRWPVRRAIPEDLLRSNRCRRLYPQRPLVTTLRLIDTFFPIALGGTACIPGPFGAGKTVLQNLISRYSAADIVIVVACGERAGEVVETIHEFPKLKDPLTGGPLMDRTIIICNTSSMPVAAREASIYTGITLGEYYRQMGLNVLVIADSTSRWAQAMRETSGRMEEIPGEEAFPAYLDSAIRGIYERAGIIRTADGREGSLTMIGTVSPAGGNFEEPVTQSTLATVKAFLGLSSDRAYKRFYPAVDPLLSWSRYLQQLAPWFNREIAPDWTERVERMIALLKAGDAVQQMMQVTGEEGVSLEDFITYQQAAFLDMVYLQQDAFDAVDVSVPLDMQKESFTLVVRAIEEVPDLPDKDAARQFYTRLTGLFKNLNYSRRDSPDYQRYIKEIEKALKGEKTSDAGTEDEEES